MSNAAYFREWRRRNPERARAIKKRWRDAHPEKQQAARERWSEANHQRELDKGHRYRARKRGAYVEKVDRLAIYERDGGICQLCDESVARDKFDLDHIVPISKGGPHMPSNVRLAHRSCNARRGNHFPMVFHDPGPPPPEALEMIESLSPQLLVLDCGRKGMWMVGPLPERGLG